MSRLSSLTCDQKMVHVQLNNETVSALSKIEAEVYIKNKIKLNHNTLIQQLILEHNTPIELLEKLKREGKIVL